MCKSLLSFMKNCETSFNWTWNINFSIDTRTFPFHLLFFLLFLFTTGCFIIKGKQWVSEEENVIKVIGMINFYCFWKKQCLCIFFILKIVFLLFFIDNFGIEGKEKFNGPSNGVNRLEIYDWIFSPSLLFCSVLLCFIT